MICDTTFLSDIPDRVPEALRLLAGHRGEAFLVTVISAGEIAVIFRTNQEARRFLAPYRVLTLKPEIALTAATIERELDQRLGENDTWIAGFCRYYGQPLISRDRDFDRVPNLRRLEY